MPEVDPASYGDAIADVYDEWYTDVSDVDGTIQTLRDLCSGGPVLELGIGTGRLALPLAASGVAVHGVDASSAMIERLRAKPGGTDIPVLVADFSERLPEVEGGFAVAFAAFNTLLNLASADAQRRCLGLVGQALRPGGTLVVEAFVPSEDAPESGVDVRQVTEDRVVLSVFKRDPVDGTVVGSLVSLSAEGVRLRPWAVRPTPPEELDALAAEAGLTLRRRDGGWRGEPYDDDSQRHVTFYGKNGGTFDAVMSA